MKENTKSKNEHFVPQFLLNGFRKTESSPIHVFDKHTGKRFSTGSRRIGAGIGFYHFNSMGRTYSLEPFLKQVDTGASRVIRKIRNSETLSGLNQEDRNILACFGAVQFLRTDDMRRHHAWLQDEICEFMTSMGHSPDAVQNFSVLSDAEIKTSSILQIVQSAKDYVPSFISKQWILFRTSDRLPFCVSDTPVTLQNVSSTFSRGDLGLDCKGVEIYLPVSKTLSLGFLCPSFCKILKDTGQLSGIAEGLPVDLAGSFEEVVRNLNELQAMFSTRFVYSTIEDFGFVKEMLDRDPDLKNGMRPQRS